MASVPAAPIRAEVELLPPRPVHRYGPLAGAGAVFCLPFALLGMLARGVPRTAPAASEALAADPDVAARAGTALLEPPLDAAPPRAGIGPELPGPFAPFAFPSALAGRAAPGLHLYAVPLGGVPDESVQLLARALEFLTGAGRVTVLPRRPLPDEAWNPESAMYDAERVLTMLRASRPHDGYRLVGVTDGDLYAADLRYLFGLASAHRDVAVLSTVRLEEPFWDREPDWDLYRWRFLKILGHELGHTLGLPHCRAGPSCLMGTIRSLGDADVTAAAWCESCRRHVRVALADPVASAPGALPLGL